MNRDLLSKLTIYSPHMTMMGYPLIYTMIIGGPFVSIVLAAIASLGAIMFLNYLRENSHIWWIGMLYPCSYS